MRDEELWACTFGELEGKITNVSDGIAGPGL
jgi:hypothetical protein